MTLTAANLDRRWPRAPHSLVDGIASAAPTIFPRFGLDSTLIIAHFMAQCSVECEAGTVMEENLHYSAERAHEVWPMRFRTIASARPYAHNPRALADFVYNGRMGNRRGTDDGWNYRGGGLLDATGRRMYRRLTKECGLDLVARPDLARDPCCALEVACAAFKLVGAVPHAAADNIIAVTEAVNGGLEGIAERRAWLMSWRHELGA